MTAVPVKASAPTLADQIDLTLTTVNWSSPTSFVVPHFGLIFTSENNYDAALPSIPDFKTLIQMKRIAELDGINSSLLNQMVAEAMINQEMTGHWPMADPDGMLVYWKFLVFTYKYANELGLNVSKWSRNEAFHEFLSLWEADHDFLWFNPANKSSIDIGDRYYDENAEVLSIFLKFYQIGVPEALDYANQMWEHICQYHWSGSYFPYRDTSGQVECEAGPFAEAIAELYVANNYSLPNFPDYILQDLNYKFITGGNWSAKLWSPEAYVVRHAESNPEKRLENTVTAWAAMQSYYPLMNESMKSNFINLLTGSPNAWQGLINSSNLYSEGRFRWRENKNYTDDATCGGAMILFLNGIVPDTGSLAIPVIDECYQDWYSMFPASHFRFNYETETIRIPVWAGRINFRFGTENASYIFPDNGIYEVHFSSDWNTVENTSKVSSLTYAFSYLNSYFENPPPQPSPPPDTTVPNVMVISPQNKTYSKEDILLTFNVNEPVAQLRYSVDGKTNVSIAKTSIILPPLTYGTHNVVVYADDIAGNTGTSRMTYFTVDTHSPTIFLLSPRNQIYNTTSIPLTFIVNEKTRWTGYSVDDRRNVTVLGNATLTGLSDGTHSIVFYARDVVGNEASTATVYLTTDITPPSISLLSPQNITYDTSEILLVFRVNETTLWMGYSLDGQPNATITGNTTLTTLPVGSHSIIVYARDLAGNTKASETTTFTFTEIQPPEPFPTAWITATAIATIAVSGTTFLFYFKRNHKQPKTRTTP